MTNEQKQLLLKDLCERLPYGVKITFRHNGFRWDWPQTLDEIKKCEDGEYAINGWGLHGIKPYLRPMSSMTEEEYAEYEDYCDSFRGAEYYELIDWLNANHFDYRGLIEMGLAIDCTNLNIY